MNAATTALSFFLTLEMRAQIDAWQAANGFTKRERSKALTRLTTLGLELAHAAEQSRTSGAIHPARALAATTAGNLRANLQIQLPSELFEVIEAWRATRAVQLSRELAMRYLLALALGTMPELIVPDTTANQLSSDVEAAGPASVGERVDVHNGPFVKVHSVVASPEWIAAVDRWRSTVAHVDTRAKAYRILLRHGLTVPSDRCPALGYKAGTSGAGIVTRMAIPADDYDRLTEWMASAGQKHMASGAMLLMSAASAARVVIAIALCDFMPELWDGISPEPTWSKKSPTPREAACASARSDHLSMFLPPPRSVQPPEALTLTELAALIRAAAETNPFVRPLADLLEGRI